MVRYLLTRVALALVVLIAAISLTFFMLYLAADPVATLRVNMIGASAEDIATRSHELGFDRPVIVQYVDYVSQAVRGEFGSSIRYSQPAMGLVLQRLPHTAQLAGVSFALALLLAIPLGILSAVFHGRTPDRAAGLFSVLGQSVPNFVVGPLLILTFAVGLGWLPVAGADSPRHIIMPAITLALYPAARTMRIVRSSVLDVLRKDYVTVARAKGFGPALLIWRHVLRNAMLPVLSVLGLQLGSMLGGAVIVETVFGWPGIGHFAVQSLLNGDFPPVQAIVVVTATTVVVISLLVDLLYAWADPQIRYA